jgi:hypothetical protein
MTAITINPRNKKEWNAVKHFIKALDLPYKETQTENYDQIFVEKINKISTNIKKGKGVKMNIEDIWN